MASHEHITTHFNKEKFINDFRTTLGEYINQMATFDGLETEDFTFDNPERETKDEFLNRIESRKKEMIEKIQNLLQKLETLSCIALKQGGNKEEILEAISSAFGELYDSEERDFEESNFLRKIILELLSNEQKK